jgi:dihydroorotase
MGRSLTVRQGRLVLPDRVVTGDLVVEDGVISQIAPRVDRAVGEEISGRNRVVLPGAIDPLVFVDTVEDLSQISVGAAAGGYTAICAAGPADTAEELRLECSRATHASRVHCGLYIRATADNLGELLAAERARGIFVPGEILHDDAVIGDILTAVSKLVVMDNFDPTRVAERASLYADAMDPADHARIHDIDSGVSATQHAVELAHKYGREMMLAHVSSEEEVALVGLRKTCVSSVVRPSQLFLDDSDLARLGTRAVCTPPVRGHRHVDALWAALLHGQIDGISTGHQGVRPEWKDRPYPQTVPGLPALQFTLPLLADAVHRGRCSWLDVARWTSQGPARILKLPRKGRLETGYDGDLVILDVTAERTIGVTADIAPPSWSPWEGRALVGWPVVTAVLGEVAHRDGEISLSVKGRML